MQKISRIKNELLTKGIRVSCKYKRDLYMHNRYRNNTQIKTQNYKKYCKILAKVIKEAQR
jgi:lysyl-tRNA synthetase class I